MTDKALVVVPPLVLVDRGAPWTQDELDRVWLSDQRQTVEAGLSKVADACIQITRNWTAGRKVGRFYPGLTPFEYLMQEIGPIRLAREERDHFLLGLITAGMSRKKAAALAGVDPDVADGVANKAGVKNPWSRNAGKPAIPPPPVLVKTVTAHIRGILGDRALLPHEIEAWLRESPDEDERAAVVAELTALVDRVTVLIERTQR